MLCAVLAVAASPVGAQVCDPAIVGNCDEDGDCFIKDNGGCKKKNKGIKTDCDDSDDMLNVDCGDGGELQAEFTAAFTAGGFQFGAGSLGFIVDELNPNKARSDAPVVLVPDDTATWEHVFGICSDVFGDPLPFTSIMVPQGRALISKAADVISIGFGGIVVMLDDGSPVEVNFRLQGVDPAYLEITLGTPVEYQLSDFAVYTSGRKGGHCRGNRNGNTLLLTPSKLVVLVP